jgi:hypothetical protein
MHYPALLTPDHEEIFKILDQTVTILGVSLTFKKWLGQPIANTFGGKPLIDYKGKPMFAELAIQRMAVASGWSARWVETYGSKGDNPYYFTDWLDATLPKQVIAPLEDLSKQALLQKIRSANNDSYSGFWDVLAWDNDTILFIESKRYKKDSVRGTQLKWLHAALKSGFEAANFLIVQWDFES